MNNYENCDLWLLQRRSSLSQNYYYISYVLYFHFKNSAAFGTEHYWRKRQPFCQFIEFHIYLSINLWGKLKVHGHFWPLLLPLSNQLEYYGDSTNMSSNCLLLCIVFLKKIFLINRLQRKNTVINSVHNIFNPKAPLTPKKKQKRASFSLISKKPLWKNRCKIA